MKANYIIRVGDPNFLYTQDKPPWAWSIHAMMTYHSLMISVVRGSCDFRTHSPFFNQPPCPPSILSPRHREELAGSASGQRFQPLHRVFLWLSFGGCSWGRWHKQHLSLTGLCFLCPKADCTKWHKQGNSKLLILEMHMQTNTDFRTPLGDKNTEIHILFDFISNLSDWEN